MALQTIAATIAVVVVATAIFALDVPERISCEVGRAVESVTTAGTTTPPCEDTTVTASQATTAEEDTTPATLTAKELSSDGLTTGRPTGRGLTATTYSSGDWVASPGTVNTSPAAMVRHATDVRCALAPDRSTWESKICLIGDSDDPHEFTRGSTDLIRCPAAEKAPSFLTCFPTTDDDARGHRTVLRTGPNDNDARFCQPVRVQATSDGSTAFRIDWGCASWAGNLYHCYSTVPAATIGTRNPDGFLSAGVGWTPRDNWTQDPTYRTLWPRTCDSRTFPTDTLACTPDENTNLAACTLRGYQRLPLRPASCVYFHPHPGEQGQPTHTVGLPLHCRLTTTTATATATATKGSPVPAGTTGLSVPGPVTLTTRCPTARRTLQADTTVGQIVCGAPQRATGQQGQAWAAFSSDLLTDPQTLPVSAVPAVPWNPEGSAAPVTNTQMMFVHQLSEHLEPGGGGFEVPNTIFHSGIPAFVQIPEGNQLHNALLVPFNASPQQVHVPFAQWLMWQLGIESANPLYRATVLAVLEILAAIDAGAIPEHPVTLDGTSSAAELLTNAVHVVANSVPPDEAALAAFVFVTHIAIVTADTPGTVGDVVSAFQGAVAEAANTLSTPELTTGLMHDLPQALAGLVSLSTPLTPQEAADALGLQLGDNADFWDPVPVPDIPQNQQAPIVTADAVFIVEQPHDPDEPVDPDAPVCLAVLPNACSKP